MTYGHTIGSSTYGPETPRALFLAVFTVALAIPFIPVLLVIVPQELSRYAGCPVGDRASCLLGGLDIAWLRRTLAEPWMYTHRSVHILHYFGYGVVLAVLSHWSFQTIWSRLGATCGAVIGITLPGLILEIYTAFLRATEICQSNATATAACANPTDMLLWNYAPMVISTWAIVFILPAAAAVTIAHAIIALGIDIFARRT